ncbi:MAG: ADP-ribosylation factor-like protein [Candidatus Helarchaeota archaeon]
MLREIFILKEKQNIYKREYGESITLEALSPILVSLIDFLKDAKEDTIEFMNIINFKIAYATDIAHNLLFIFITDLTDDNENIEEQLEIYKYEFFSRFENIIDDNADFSVYASFDDVSDQIFKELRPKIALIGFSGVGKTTITRLIRAEDIPMRHVPTITGDVATIKIGHINLYLWDFAGQEKYSFVWNKFIKGADAVILILDSTPKNVKESKFFIELIKKEEPHAKIAIVANKQDLPDSLSPEEIEKELGYQTTGLIAIDPASREKMLYIIADCVKVRSLIQPFIEPLLQRDKLIAEAEAAIISGNIQLAAEKFDAIAELSAILEEPEMYEHFKSQAEILKAKLMELQKAIVQTTVVEKPLSSKIQSEIEEKISIPKPFEEETIPMDQLEEEKRKKEEEKRKKEEEKAKKEEEKAKKEEEKAKKEEEKRKKEEEKRKKEEEKRKKEEEKRKKEEEKAKKEEEVTEIEEQIPKRSPEIDRLEKEIEKINFKKNLLITQFSNNEIEEIVFNRVLEKLEKQKKELDEKLKELNSNEIKN